MISTFIGAAHFNNGVLSIEPNSRNLIIYADDSPRTNSISIRGPYTIDTAIENESDIIRMPSDAMLTLGVKVNDTIEIDGEIYKINDTRMGEGDILRLPIHVKKDLGVANGDVIQNSRLKEIFAGSVAVHYSDAENISYSEKFEISQRDRNAMIYEIIINNESVSNTTGIFKANNSYEVSINDDYFTSVNVDGNNTFNYLDNTIEIKFKDTNSTSIKNYIEGNFLNINLYKP